MNWADYTIIGVLAVSVMLGLWRGLISEVLGLVVWIAAVWVAWVFGDQVADMLADSVKLPSARMVLGYGACFIAVLILGALLRFVMGKLVEGTGLSGSDRLLGMLFGLARGVLVIVLVVMLLGFTPFPRDPWWHQSQLLPSFRSAAIWLGDKLPADLERYLNFDPTVLSRTAAGELGKHIIPVAADLLPATATSSAVPAADSSTDRN